jgi:hypothetical protein
MTPELSDPVTILGIVVATVVLIGAAALYLRKNRTAGQLPAATSGEMTNRLAYQPQTRPVPPITPKSIPRVVVKKTEIPAPEPREVSLLNGRSDITDSLHALAEKYSLDKFTIATSDGLVFASSGAGSAQEDAAHYSEMFVNDPLCETPGVTLSSLIYQGSDLILIIGTTQPVSQKIQQSIENDTKDILNWWI